MPSVGREDGNGDDEYLKASWDTQDEEDVRAYSRQCWGANSSAKPECRCLNDTLQDSRSKRPTIKVLCPVTGWVGGAVSAFLLKIVIEQKLGAFFAHAARVPAKIHPSRRESESSAWARHNRTRERAFGERALKLCRLSC